jgi:hypothetical protein
MQDKGKKQAAWLLIKDQDSYARASAAYSVVDDLPASVMSLHRPARAASATARVRPRSATDRNLPVEALAHRLRQLELVR